MSSGNIIGIGTRINAKGAVTISNLTSNGNGNENLQIDNTSGSGAVTVTGGIFNNSDRRQWGCGGFQRRDHLHECGSTGELGEWFGAAELHGSQRPGGDG